MIMHMADALLSPAVGGSMWAVSAATIAYCSKKVRTELDERKVPLMGVMGAFLFAAQMINFTIPATGSSGHLGGGLLLTILLGPYAGFLTIASVLVVQALFFADGGILALGCNIFNMGFFPAFVVYPLLFNKKFDIYSSQIRLTIAIMIAAIVSLQLGPFAVVLETYFSGISSLPFTTFLLLMQPIHLAIGAVEGFVTVAVVSFVFRARPEILRNSMEALPVGTYPIRNILMVFMASAIFTGGIVSWFASKNPDGLEWAIAKVTGKEELQKSEQGLHGILARLQEKTAFLPDYSFRKAGEPKKEGEGEKSGEENKQDQGSNLGTSVSGIVGSLLTMALALLGGFLLKRRSQSPTRRR
jgi:cobalt/nickel transport system permease protein